MSFVDNVLAHHGVKGMRWGVRKARGGVTVARKGKPAPSEDKLKANAARAKVGKRGNTDALSNDELRTLINRINAEQSAHRLLAAQQEAGAKAFIKRTLVKTVAPDFVNYAQGKETKFVGAAMAAAGIAAKAKGRHIKTK